MYLFYGVMLFTFGHIFGWYASNLQFTSDWWAARPILSVVTFGFPAGICFLFGNRFCMLALPELWTARFLAAVVSYSVFPAMTWYYLGESPFTLKTMLCVALAFSILLVQIFVD